MNMRPLPAVRDVTLIVMIFVTPVNPVALAIDMWTTPEEMVNTGGFGPVGLGTMTVPGRNEISASMRAAPTVLPRVSRTTCTNAVSPILVRSVSYTHLRAHETPEHLVCRLLLE